MDKGAGNEVASMLQHAMHNVSGQELDILGSPEQAPACMEQLEMHMSLERDEWMKTNGDSLTGLFMPFVNLHTQVQALLTDYPDMTHRAMKWDVTARQTSAEYAAFMLTHMLKAWKSQVCRTVRMRQSMKSVWWWRYQFV